MNNKGPGAIIVLALLLTLFGYDAFAAATTLLTVKGAKLGDGFARSVAGVGDVNQDGFDDFVVGINNDGNCTIGSTGAAEVYSGKDGSRIYRWCGNNGDAFGWSVAGAGDVNADGVPDVIVGSTSADNPNLAPGNNSGSTKVFSGLDGSLLYTFYGDSFASQFGHSVNNAGDVNKDGFDDIAVGAFFDDNGGYDSGLLRIFSGADGSVLYNFTGDAANDHLGISVNGAGDVNNDGYPDVIAGAEAVLNAFPSRGYARVYSGKDGTTLYTWYGQNAYDAFGWSVDGAGDVNGDGNSDLLIGAPGISTYTNIAGYADIYSGKNGRLLYRWNGINPKDYFGYAVSGVGDMDTDGTPDVLVGAPIFIPYQQPGSSGYAELFSGKNGARLEHITGVGQASAKIVNDKAALGKILYEPADRFGISVSDAGDLNSDGKPDILISADFSKYWPPDGIGYARALTR